MTSAALADLSTRIASNTLTGPQQAALTTALALIIPTFPSPDDTSNSIPPTEGALARAWIAALYTIQAEAGGTAVLPTTQIAWFINALTGSDTNDGASPATALKTVAELGRRWRGTAGGGRPVLSPATGSTITVTLASDIPVSDPLAPILDVDIDSPGATPVSLIIKGSAKTAAVVGTLNTASAFARTSAGGQIKITDTGVTDYSSFVGHQSLFVDTTSGAVAWLYAPNLAPSATGTLSVGYSAQSAGSSAIPTQTTIAGADSYQLADVTHASLGSGFVTRSGPLQSTSVTGQPASVFFYRLHLQQPTNNDTVTTESATVVYTFQECQLDHQFQVVAGGVTFSNCASFSLGFHASGSALLEMLAGVVQGSASGSVSAAGGAVAFLDLDAAIASGTSISVQTAAKMLIGNASFWGNGASIAALAVSNATVTLQPILEAGTVFYGHDDGLVLDVFGSTGSGGAIVYHNDGGGTPAADQFKFNDSNFKLGALTSAFGFNSTTGATVGPTTNTFAHLDAALAAGTGFGGQAIDPGSGNYLRIAT